MRDSRSTKSLHNRWFAQMLLAVGLCVPVSVQAQKIPALLELKTAKESIQGKLVVSDDHACWLMQPDGRLSRVELDQVTAYQTVAPRFEHYTSMQMRDQLYRELDKNYEVVARGDYIVGAPRGQAQDYASLCDQIARRFESYFSVRRIPVAKSKAPLVALVFANQSEFAAYCRQDGFRATPGLGGYYLPTSNRVALFDPQGNTGLGSRSSLNSLDHWETLFATSPRQPILTGQVNQPGPDQLPVARIDGRLANNVALRDTIIHEVTHQIAFNMGLHSRIGENPKWIVEGLAMVFESEGVRNGSRTGSAVQRVNAERLAWFADYTNKRRQRRTLAQFIASDQLFQTSALDAYSEAWAFTFYLIETRHSDYFRYLKRVAGRNPFGEYSARERLADFAAIFGKDFDLLEAGLLRFSDDLAHNASR